jgi:glutamyl-tRNA reductase
MAMRREEISKAEMILSEEEASFEKWLNTLDAFPTISSIVKKAEMIKKEEMEKLEKVLRELDPEKRKAVEIAVDGIVHKIMHAPVSQLKIAAGEGNGMAYVEAARKLFKVDEDEGKQ